MVSEQILASIESLLPVIALIVLFGLLAFEFLKVFTRRLSDSMEGHDEEAMKSVRAIVRFGYISILVLTGLAILPFLLPTFPQVFPHAQAPMQLLKASQGDGGTGSAADTQWLLNIGGEVRSKPPTGSQPAKWKELLRSAFAEARTATRTTIREAEDLPVEARDSLTESLAEALGRVQDEHEAKVTSDSDAALVVSSGLVVPFYVIIIALFGGCIGMTRKLPELQMRGAPLYIRYYKKNHAIDPTLKPPLDPVRVREHVVFQIMQAVFAPFLAVVAYALIETTDVKGIVAIAFVSGFASETILVQIRKVADATSSISTSAPTPNLRIPTPNPIPRVDALDPPKKAVGDADLKLSVEGAGFAKGAVVRLDGQSRKTTFVTKEKLVAQLTAPDVASAGQPMITVLNPEPGGGESDAHPLDVS